MVKAVINGERVECGACGALLCVITKGNTITLTHTAEHKAANIGFQIKCKHKANGKTCNEINEILL